VGLIVSVEICGLIMGRSDFYPSPHCSAKTFAYLLAALDWWVYSQSLTKCEIATPRVKSTAVAAIIMTLNGSALL